MIDGFYQITLKSPMGLKEGTLDVFSEGSKLIGTFQILKNKNSFEGELLGDSEFLIRGQIITSASQVEYELKGRVTEEELKGWVETPKVIMELKGRRLERDDKNGKSTNR